MNFWVGIVAIGAVASITKEAIQAYVRINEIKQPKA